MSEDFDLEHISERGAADVDRPGEDVIAGSLFHLLMNLDDVGENVEAAVLGRHPLGIAGGALDRTRSPESMVSAGLMVASR